MFPALRPAVPDDLPAVLQMAEGPMRDLDAETLRARIFDLGLARLWVAAEPEGLVGYALVLVRPNLGSGPAAWELAHLCVHEWRRGAGIGARLLAAILAEGGKGLVSAAWEGQKACLRMDAEPAPSSFPIARAG